MVTLLYRRSLNQNEITQILNNTQKNYKLNKLDGYNIIINNDIASTLIKTEILEEGKYHLCFWKKKEQN